jgi:cytochrome c biogenesis protein ResB
MNKIYAIVRHVALVVVLVGMVWVTNLATASAVPAEPSYSPGAPSHPPARQTTEYQGKVIQQSSRPENKGLTSKIEKMVN